MKVALFIPCYIDQFYPQVGQATLELLTKLGCDAILPAMIISWVPPAVVCCI
jgi:L-lactate dehydrogenase complex protein LldE